METGRLIKYLSFFILVIFMFNSAQSQSPYKCSWSKDGWIFGAGVILTFASSVVDNLPNSLTLQEIEHLQRYSINWFDRGATYRFSEASGKASDYLAGICATTPALLFLDEKSGNDLYTVSIMYIETMMFSEIVSSLAKGSVKRIRPLAYNPEVPLNKKTTSDARKSFFSRHTTIAFASSVFFSTVYDTYYPQSKWKLYILTSSLLEAGVIGYLRYESGYHFPSDIIVGAVVGSVIGYCIPLLHKTNNENLSVFPAFGLQSGITMQLRF
jgi:membrane-associated phospholipid phosphatase